MSEIEQSPENEATKRGPGRPKLPDGAARDKSVSAAMTKAEREQCRAKADAAGKPLATWARDLLLAALVGSMLIACGGAGSGASARDAQIKAIDASGFVLQLIASELGTVARADAQRTCGTLEETPESHDCLERVAAHYAPADAALDTAHDALAAWLSSVDGAPIDAARAVVSAYENMRIALAAFDIKVPDMPQSVKDALRALLGSSGGEDTALDGGTDSGDPDTGVDAGTGFPS